MNQIGKFALTCVFVAVILQVPVDAHKSCDSWNCSLFLTNQEAVRRQFAQIDHSKIWLVYLNLTEQPNGSSNNSKLSLLLIWTKSPNSPFLTFDSNFELYSFSMLTEAVTQINMQATSVGPDSLRDCLDQLPLNCRNRTIAKEILSNVTDMKGAVCFGDLGKSPSRLCCEQSEGNKTDIECGIKPQNGWQWLDISYMSALFGIVGYFSLPILFCLLPPLPDSQNGIEVTSLIDPSPLSLLNIFVKCFNYKPAHCLRDVLVTFCCRITVHFGLFSSVLYLIIIAFRVFSKKVYVFYIPEFDNFTIIVVFSYAAAFVYAVSVSVIPFLEYYLQYDGRENSRQGGFFSALYMSLLKCGYEILGKGWLNLATAFCHNLFWYLIPFCCQDKREISKFFNFPAGLYLLLSPCLLIVVVFCVLIVVFFFPLYISVILPIKIFNFYFGQNERGITACKYCFIVSILSSVTFLTQIMVIIYNCDHLASFATYTIIGFVLSYKLHLPLLSAAVLAVTYVNQFYRSTNESYDELRRIAFEVCTEMHAELNNDNRNKQLTAGPSLHKQEQGQNGERQPLLSNQPRQLIYVDKNGSQLIPKKLFDNICWEIKPIGLSLFFMATKVFGILMFVITLVGVVLTLTPRSEFGTLTQAAVTLFVGGLPKILSVFSKNRAMEKLQTMETKSRITSCVKNYLEKGELSEEQFLELETERAFKIKNL